MSVYVADLPKEAALGLVGWCPTCGNRCSSWCRFCAAPREGEAYARGYFMANYVPPRRDGDVWFRPFGLNPYDLFTENYERWNGGYAACISDFGEDRRFASAISIEARA